MSHFGKKAPLKCLRCPKVTTIVPSKERPRTGLCRSCSAYYRRLRIKNEYSEKFTIPVFIKEHPYRYSLNYIPLESMQGTPSAEPLPGFLICGPQTQGLLERVEKIAPLNSPVLVEGGTGTGKEAVVMLLHKKSPRCDKPLVIENCGGLATADLAAATLFGYVPGAYTGAIGESKGLFGEADGGTLYLDEIQALPTAIQVQLLRAIQFGAVRQVGSTKTRRVNVRVIASTNTSAEDLLKKGLLREDLFYRFTFRICVAPLHERMDEIPALAEHYVRELSKGACSLHPAAMSALVKYLWPGNIRELINVLTNACAVAKNGGIIRLDHLPAEVCKPRSKPELVPATGT